MLISSVPMPRSSCSWAGYLFMEIYFLILPIEILLCFAWNVICNHVTGNVKVKGVWFTKACYYFHKLKQRLAFCPGQVRVSYIPLHYNSICQVVLLWYNQELIDLFTGAELIISTSFLFKKWFKSKK